MTATEYSDRECTVYVGSIDKKVSEEIIYELFLQVIIEMMFWMNDITTELEIVFSYLR